MGIVDALGLVALLLVLPAVSLLQLRFLKDVEIDRVPVYLSSAATLVVIGLGALALGVLHGGRATLGLGRGDLHALLGWGAGLTLAGLALMVAFRGFSRRLGIRESRFLIALLPRTRREKRLFLGLSLAAGAGEELAYRGYVVSVLGGLVSPMFAVVVSAAAFGIMHAYQGTFGVLRTALLGLLLGWGFVRSGSLWPVMAAHAALDVLAGLVLASWLVPPEAVPVERAGVWQEEGTPPGPRDTTQP